ncbi:hypothetical protein TrVFT333_006071 [Trichoderma virens FT-333]|nr:hypothetical protein TrVFT333_006071 [Trichoderma virens FT-333]
MKREDGSTGRSILHEYQMHRKLLEASLLSDTTSFAIPRSFGYLSSQDITAWSGVLPRLPENYTGCNAIVSEKIIPVPSSTRRLLVQTFRPDVDEESVPNSQNNEHCLIRPYLGRRRYRRSPHTMWILDFDLCRDLTLDEKGIEQASNAFWGNDPYYPRPGSVNPANQRLWSIFEERFIQSSSKALRSESNDIKQLPKLLMEKIKSAKASIEFRKT